MTGSGLASAAARAAVRVDEVERRRASLSRRANAIVWPSATTRDRRPRRGSASSPTSTSSSWGHDSDRCPVFVALHESLTAMRCRPGSRSVRTSTLSRVGAASGSRSGARARDADPGQRDVDRTFRRFACRRRTCGRRASTRDRPRSARRMAVRGRVARCRRRSRCRSGRPGTPRDPRCGRRSRTGEARRSETGRIARARIQSTRSERNRATSGMARGRCPTPR